MSGVLPELLRECFQTRGGNGKAILENIAHQIFNCSHCLIVIRL